MRSRTLPALLVGIVAAALSALRLWLTNHDALTQVLWAEDGLFPLCVEKAGFARCVVDPFAGYLLVLPRLTAGLVAQLPAQQWALAANTLAAVLVGIVSALAFAWSRRSGLSPLGSTIIGLLPVLLPIIGVEAVNALGSAYMPLLFLATLVTGLQLRGRPAGRLAAVLIALLLLLAALTIPLTLLLVLAIIWQAVRGAVRRGIAVLWSVVILVGVAAQAVTAMTAEKPRAIAIGGDSLASYLDALPRTLATLIGLRSEVAVDGGFTLPSAPTILGPLSAIVLLAVGVLLTWRRSDLPRAAGLLVLMGLGFGVIPSVIGWANNRYFVVPLLLWTAALIVVLDRPLARWARTTPRRFVLGLGVLLVLLAWAPQLPASVWRSTPAPAWSAEVDRIVARCTGDPGIVERPIFSPFWPPNWGDGLSEPTHPSFPCVLAWRWRVDPSLS